MPTRRRIGAALALSLAVMAGACGRGYNADSEPAPATASTGLDPVGTYDFTATLGGDIRSGTIEIERTASGFGGEAWVEHEPHPAVIDSVRVSDSHMSLFLTVPGDPIAMELDFTGASFTGFIHAGGESISVFGAKRAP